MPNTGDPDSNGDGLLGPNVPAEATPPDDGKDN